MNLLFFFVHPSKFHVFRNTINALYSLGHNVEVLITSKDVLEDLVKAEGWEYTNIFPEGRKIKGLHPYLSSGINFIRTIFRLYKYCRKRNYDLFITDDLLVFVSKWLKAPSFMFIDDDISVVKKIAFLLSKADYILAPEITDIGKYSHKKIGFDGYKELAYLHPAVFKPNLEVVKSFNPTLVPYFIIRLVSLRAYHDVGMRGLANNQVKILIDILEEKGRVYISSERELSSDYEKYRIKINPADISHVLYFAEMFIGDSQTMTSEAAVLGTPAFRCNDFAGKISVMEEKEKKYGLSFNYSPERFNEMLEVIKNMLDADSFKSEFRLKKDKMIKDKINLSEFMIWLFGNFPDSIIEYKNNKQIQYKFK